jgi:hypothetical protein
MGAAKLLESAVEHAQLLQKVTGFLESLIV